VKKRWKLAPIVGEFAACWFWPTGRDLVMSLISVSTSYDELNGSLPTRKQ